MATLDKELLRWRPVYALERLLSRTALSRLRFIFGVLTCIFALLSLSTVWYSPMPYPLLWYGLGLISFGLWLEQVMLYGYHNFWYFAGLNSLIGREEITPSPITYDVAQALHNTPHDITAGFLRHPLGVTIWQRAELTPEAREDFLQQQRTPITADQLSLPVLGTYSLQGLGQDLVKHDTDLKRFLETHGVTAEHWRGAVSWVVKDHVSQKVAQRWWGKDNLLRTNGIGKQWSYGYTNTLNRFLKPVQTSAVFSVFGSLPQFAQAKVDELAQTLLQEKAGNVMIIGAAGVGKTDVVVALEQRIAGNAAPAGLQHKRISVLDTERLLAVHEDATALEQTMMTVLQEARDAGNAVIVIENLSTFIGAAAERGVRIPELLDTYLAHPDIQFIATDTPHGFHRELQPLGALTRRFGQVMIDEPDTQTVVSILQQSCRGVEKQHGVLYTYPALVLIAQGAKRYITDGVPPDSALTLMVEVAQHGAAQGGVIDRTVVESYLKQKTGIPMGSIDEEERDVLMHLEDTLHHHVIGQDAAIDAIGKTIRRARVGIQSSDRPMGSFLFLGPTGVGKTETAKTLAKVFFGSPEEMVRFDMSEYSAPDALAHLIGSQQEAGALSNALHDHPYCVLLLDEFEKATSSVHDLFLQVLDEGQFTDGRGAHVNARNTIIIATANAGSELIYKTTSQRQTDPTLNQRIIDHIIEAGHFRPELINRFDNTIIFEPLKEGEQQQVADIMLRQLSDRLHEQNYELTLDQEVKAYLLEHGYSEQFGARAMRREIQDTIEAAVADKIIADGLRPGDTIHLTRADIG